jgi:hypothetical protein
MVTLQANHHGVTECTEGHGEFPNRIHIRLTSRKHPFGERVMADRPHKNFR